MDVSKKLLDVSEKKANVLMVWSTSDDFFQNNGIKKTATWIKMMLQSETFARARMKKPKLWKWWVSVSLCKYRAKPCFQGVKMKKYLRKNVHLFRWSFRFKCRAKIIVFFEKKIFFIVFLLTAYPLRSSWIKYSSKEAVSKEHGWRGWHGFTQIWNSWYVWLLKL